MSETMEAVLCEVFWIKDWLFDCLMGENPRTDLLEEHFNASCCCRHPGSNAGSTNIYMITKPFLTKLFWSIIKKKKFCEGVNTVLPYYVYVLCVPLTTYTEHFTSDTYVTNMGWGSFPHNNKQVSSISWTFCSLIQFGHYLPRDFVRSHR